MKMIIAASIAVLSFSANANEPSQAMSSEVYDLLSSKTYWEDQSGTDSVPALNSCFEKGREKGKSGKALLRSIDSCMSKAGYEKKQFESQG